MRAVVFDLDGVLTDTASVHAAAWKRMFDEFLERRARETGGRFEPFVDADYRRFVDGKPRYDGVRSFLASRGIELPEGDPSDPPDRLTVCGLGNRKNDAFLEHLRTSGAAPYPSTIRFVRRLRDRGVLVAVVSASRNLEEVLDAASIDDLFEVRVGGRTAAELGLPGKPDPAMFLEAARRLGVEPNEAAIVEDAIAGVEAGRRGGFALVVGVDRTGHAPALRAAGADVVVGDPAELLPAAPADPGGGRRIRELPFAVDRPGEVLAALAGRRPAVFLDYDGTLTPIVARPEEALLSPETRAVVERLAAACPVAVVSGRDLADVRRMVALDGIAYAGSHGFDILRPDGSSFQRGREYLPDLDAAEAALRPLVEEVPGARVERKTFAIAVHVRNVEPARVPEVEAAVARVAAGAPRLRRTGGKKVEELRPDVDWDKGTALEFLIDVLGLGGGDVVPIYVGDDQTDEDAFRALGEPGIGVVVRGEDDDRPTHAGYAVRDADETRRFLEIVAAAAEGARG